MGERMCQLYSGRIRELSNNLCALPYCRVPIIGLVHNQEIYLESPPLTPPEGGELVPSPFRGRLGWGKMKPIMLLENALGLNDKKRALILGVRQLVS